MRQAALLPGPAGPGLTPPRMIGAEPMTRLMPKAGVNSPAWQTDRVEDDGSVELDVGVDGHARLVPGKGAKTSRSHCHG
jgi:hypothetical protein